MERTKIFISYSHVDRNWLDRLKAHLALLERKGFVHIWSDTRIDIGSKWKDEIEHALRECRVVVLMISPDFLASEFIWREEIPIIMRHQREGMVIFPLLVRPCAWRISSELADLQAHPRDGRPLALDTAAQVDLGLTRFTYELAARTEQISEYLATRETDKNRAWQAERLASERSSSRSPNDMKDNDNENLPSSEVCLPIKIGEEWVGEYPSTRRKFKLAVDPSADDGFTAKMSYTDDGSETLARVALIRLDDPRVDERAHEEARSRGILNYDCAVVIRETDLKKSGSRPPKIGGEYIGIVSSTKMAGIYQANGQVLGGFYLEHRG